jgi:hypothetical protein
MIVVLVWPLLETSRLLRAVSGTLSNQNSAMAPACQSAARLQSRSAPEPENPARPTSISMSAGADNLSSRLPAEVASRSFRRLAQGLDRKMIEVRARAKMHLTARFRLTTRAHPPTTAAIHRGAFGGSSITNSCRLNGNLPSGAPSLATKSTLSYAMKTNR